MSGPLATGTQIVFKKGLPIATNNIFSWNFVTYFGYFG